MKKLAKIVLRFIVSMIAVELAISVVLVAHAVAEKRFSTVLEAVSGELLSIMPLAVLVAAFLCYYPLTRLYASRLLGYLTLVVLGTLFLALPVVALRLDWIDAPLRDSSLAAAWNYLPISSWYVSLVGLPWLEAGLSILAYACFVSSFWGLSRQSTHRPLWGAFLAPALGLGAVYLFGAFLSGIAEAGFRLVGVTFSRLWSGTILAAISALCLVLFDFTLCPKTEPGRHHG